MKKTALLTRLLSCLMILCLLCGFVPGAGMTVRAEGGTWEYRILDSGEAEIIGYTDKSASTLTIPLSLGGAWVRSVAAGALADLSVLRSVTIPASVTDFSPGAFPADVTLRAYHGAQAHSYAKAAELSSVDLSAYDFMPSILDLSDMPSSLWTMTGSAVRIGQPFASLISVDDCLYLPPNGEYGQGRPVLVQALTLEGDSAVLTVCDLAFADAIASYTITDAPIIPDYASFEPAEGVKVGYNGLGLSSRGEQKGLPVELALTEGNASAVIKANIVVSGDASVKYLNNALQSVSVDVNVEAQEFVFELSVAGEKKEDRKTKLPFVKEHRIGGLTLYTAGLVHLHLELYVSISAEGKVSFYSRSLQVSAHASWTKEAGGNCYFDKNFSPISMKDAEVTVKAGFVGEISVHLGFDVTPLRVKVVSLELFLGYQGKAAATPETPCMDLTLDLILEGSFAVGWLETGKLNYNRKLLDKPTAIDTVNDSISLSLKWDFPPLTLPMVHRHWEECEVWQDYCTYNDTTTFYFMTMCDDAIEPITVKKGETPHAPRSPEREGYTFAGWYEDEAYTMPWSPAPIAEPAKVIYAKWQKDEAPTPTPDPVVQPTPTPAPSYEEEIGGTTMTVPYPVFSADLTSRLLKYEYDSEYGGYAITGSEEGRLIDRIDNPDGSFYLDYSNYNLFMNNQWTIPVPASIDGIPVVSLRGRVPGAAIFLPDSIRYIGAEGDYISADQYWLNIPANLEYVANRAILYPRFIDTDVVFPPTLKYIGWENFVGSNAASVTFQGSDIVLSEVFAVSPNLTTVDLGNAVSVVGSLAFRHCPIEEVRIPASVTRIDADAFINIHENTIVKFIIEPRSTQLVIGSEDYYYFRWINLVFAPGTKNIDVVCKGDVRILCFSLPEGVTSISRLLPFINNEKSISLKLPDSLVRIGLSAGDWQANGISGSNCLKELILSENLISIEAGSFYFSSGLENIVFNEKLEYIGAHAFERCGNLHITAFPDSLTFIGEYAFANSAVGAFDQLLTFPAGDCQVGKYALSNDWLKHIVVPGDIIAGEYIFGDPAAAPLLSAQIRQGSRIDAYLQEYYPSVERIYLEEDGEEDADESRKYTVTFNTRGFARVESMQVAAGELIPVPDDPVGDSRQFTGWYKDSHCLYPWNFGADVMPEENLTLYAGWKYVFTSTYLTERDEIILTELIEPEADTVIPSVYDEKTVVGLGAHCIPAEVVNLTLPETLRSIDPLTFVNASGLQSITVTEGNEHFYAVDGVLYAADGTLVCYPQARTGAEFTAAQGTTALAENAFCRVQHLNGLTLPAGVKIIQNGAFNDCDALGSVTLAADVASLADDAVQYCSPAFYGVKNAPVITAWADRNSLYYNCYSLVCMSLGEVALAVPVRAGETLPEIPVSGIGLQHVSDWATDKKGTALWDFANGVMPEEDLILYAVWSYDFTWEATDTGVTLTSYTGSARTITIPHEIDGTPVTAIADDCFGSMTGLTLVDDTGSITEQYAADKGFAFQRRVYTVSYLTDGGTQIAANSAAAGDPIPLPEPPKKNSYAFSQWYEPNLGYVTADTVMPGRDVYLQAYYSYVGGDESADGLIWEERDGEIIILGYTANYALTVPAVINGLPVTAIADNAFAGSSAWSITLPESIKSIGEGAFRDCAELTSITIPSGVTELKQNTFYGCLKLMDVTLSEGLETIGANAFGRCLSLTQLTLPASVKSVAPQAFSGSRKLQTLHVADANTAYTAVDGVLFSKDKKTLVIYPEGKTAESYTIPAGVTTIGEYAMQGSSLRELYLAASVTTIQEGALQFSENLETLMLPNSGKLVSIGEYAFTGCRSLKTLTLPAALQEIGSHAFTNTSLTELYANSTVIMDAQAFTAVDELVIYGTKNTAAHQWAQDNGVRFIDASTDIPVKTITVQAEATLIPGGTLTLKPVTAPANATEKFTITYTSSKPYVASVDEQGGITAHMDGVAVITAKAATGVTAECVVTVRRDEIPMEGITLSVTELILREGESCPVSWAVYPANATANIGGSPVWKSSSTGVVRWDDKAQKLVAVGLGDAIVTITLDNGISGTVTVSVQRRLELPAGLKILDAEAFMGGIFSHVVLPDGLRSIGARAFASCTVLTEIYIPASVTDIAADAFEGSKNVTILCEKGSAAETFAVQQGLKYSVE